MSSIRFLLGLPFTSIVRRVEQKMRCRLREKSLNECRRLCIQKQSTTMSTFIKSHTFNFYFTHWIASIFLFKQQTLRCTNTRACSSSNTQAQDDCSFEHAETCAVVSTVRCRCHVLGLKWFAVCSVYFVKMCLFVITLRQSVLNTLTHISTQHDGKSIILLS